MNDSFLYQFRRSPRQEFANELYSRISRQGKALMFSRLKLPTMKQVAFGLTVLCLAFATAFAAFPVVRARVGAAVGSPRTLVKEVDQLPGGTEQAEKVIPPLRSMSLAEAQAIFPLRIPSWAPEGFVLKDEVQIQEYGDKSVMLVWENEARRQRIYLHVHYTIVPEVVGRGSAEEVEVNGQSAVLVRGAWSTEEKPVLSLESEGGVKGDIEVHVLEWGIWNPRTQRWKPTGLVRLRWQQDGVTYQLITTEGTISTSDLVRMAESMQ